MIKNKKQMLLVITIFTLLLTIGSVTYAFFNYTRTGAANTLKVGRIAFNSTQTNIELENVFPTSSTNLNSSNSDNATITIIGDITYTGGIEYKVTLEDVNNTINGKEVPISIRATANNLGTADSNYYTNRENKTKIYKLNSEGEAYNGKYIAVGYIPEGSTGVNGSINITAFIDTNKVAISDTYNGNETDLMGTTNDWVMGREVFTTTEWNNFASTPLSFKVRVEANEGIWVEQEKFLTMKNIFSDSNWSAIRSNITSIEFHKDGVAPANPITSFDVTDATSDVSKGNITLYTVDDGLGTNTYKAIIVANDTIYTPENCQYMFGMMTKLSSFNSENLKVDNSTNFKGLFGNCSNLENINSLTVWNTYKVTDMTMLFYGCASLKSISSLKNWNVENVERMANMFNSCSKITNISWISNWKTNNVNNMVQMFFRCIGLNNLTGIESWDIQSVTNFNLMFGECSNLSDASGINDWNINENATFSQMFKDSPSHPEFSKFPNGTWDENGTYTPNA